MASALRSIQPKALSKRRKKGKRRDGFSDVHYKAKFTSYVSIFMFFNNSIQSLCHITYQDFTLKVSNCKTFSSIQGTSRYFKIETEIPIDISSL